MTDPTQVTPQDGESQAAPQAPAGEQPSQPSDDPVAALASMMKGLGNDYTPENLVDKAKDMHSGMTKAQQEAAQVRQENETLKQQLQQLQQYGAGSDPSTLNQQQQAQQGVAQNPQQGYDFNGYNPDMDPAMVEIGTVKQQLQATQARLDERDMQDKFAQIRSAGLPLEPGTETMVRQRIAQSGYNDAFAHYWALMGGRVMEAARKQGADQQAHADAERNLSHAPTAAGGTPAPSVPAGNMSGDDKINAIAQIMAGGNQ